MDGKTITGIPVEQGTVCVLCLPQNLQATRLIEWRSIGSKTAVPLSELQEAHGTTGAALQHTRQRDVRAWREIERLYEAGERFHHYRPGSK